MMSTVTLGRALAIVAVVLGAAGCSSADPRQTDTATGPTTENSTQGSLTMTPALSQSSVSTPTEGGSVAPPTTDAPNDGDLLAVYRFESLSPIGECIRLPLELEPTNIVEVPDGVHRVLVLGDSIVASRGDGERGGQFDVMRCLVSDFPALGSIEMDLRAVPGQTIITQPPYSSSRGAVLSTFVEDLFRDGADVPDTVLITPSINELVVSTASNRTDRINSALEALDNIVSNLHLVGVINVIVLPMPPVATRWTVASDDGRRTAEDIVALNAEGRKRGIIVPDLDYGLDFDGDGFGETAFYDNIPTEPGADSFDGAHLDADGQWMVGSAIFTRLATSQLSPP